jgi:hypothetical protein
LPIGLALLAVQARVKWIPILFVAIAGLSYPVNVAMGWSSLNMIARDLRSCKQQLHDGAPARKLAEEYDFKIFNHIEYFTSALEEYRRRRPLD